MIPKEEFAKELGQRIREARVRSGMTQAELGKLVGKEQRTISEYEKGIRNMYASDIPIFAVALKVSVGYLIPDSTVDPELTQSLLSEFETLPDNDKVRQMAVDLVRVLGSHLRNFES